MDMYKENAIAKWQDHRKFARGHWYVHFASCFYIDIYCIMGCYYTLCRNTYAFSLLFDKVYMKRENAGSWNSWLEKEQILETYSVQLQKSWNSTKYLNINKEKSSPKMKARGPTPCSRGWGARPPPRARPYLVGPLVGLRRPSSAIWSLSSRKKNQKQPFGTKLRRHEAEPI